jgi:poly(3-hydroxybutyrate) depolymerase
MTSPRALLTLIATGLALALPSARAATAAADTLPPLKVNRAETSVSGLSAGAFMAVQLQVAYAASIQGVGVVAGGPYHCAADHLAQALPCMGKFAALMPDLHAMTAAARGYAATGQVDATEHLAKRRIYVFHGSEDSVAGSPTTDATALFFKQMGVPASQIRYEHQLPAGHALISPKGQSACAATTSPYLNRCMSNGQPYDQAGAILAHIYGPLQPRAASAGGRLLALNQRDHASADTGMAEQAWVYVPRSCTGGSTCRVHVALHGCRQSAEKVGQQFVTEAGYNEWADANRLLVLYPQVDASLRPFNPNGCWDWWGYTGSAYATQAGPQMRAIMAMVAGLARGGAKP